MPTISDCSGDGYFRGDKERQTTERNLKYHIDSYINVVARVRYICDDLRLDNISTYILRGRGGGGY